MLKHHQDLSNTLWAYGTLNHKRNEHMRAINWEVMRQIEWFSPQGASYETETGTNDLKSGFCQSLHYVHLFVSRCFLSLFEKLLCMVQTNPFGSLLTPRRPDAIQPGLSNVIWGLSAIEYRDMCLGNEIKPPTKN